MKKIACSIALLIAASVAVAEELFTFVNDGDGYGYSYIRINQDLDSFSFSSDWHSLGNVGKVGYVVYTADMSEIDCAAYMEANANNPEFGKNINGGVIDLGALKAGDRVGFYEVRPNGSTYTQSAFKEWKNQLWLAFYKGGSDTKDEWMTIEDIKAVSAGGSSPCDSVAVSNVVARQRWPWNGLVDVDYEVGGDPDKLANLGVSVVFEELGGENRRWVATKFLDNANRIASVGRHRLTWDTKAQGVTNVVAAKVVAAVSLTELPVFVAYSTGMASAGGVLGIAGKRLDLVKTITFCGSECPVDVTASASETMINLVVPMDSKTGKLVATLANGMEVEFPSIGVVEAVFCYAKSLPGDDVELKAGGAMTITATNIDKLKSVEINDVECQYSVTGNLIAVEIPETTSAKATLKLVSVNGEISYSISVIPKAVSETNERQTIIWYNT